MRILSTHAHGALDYVMGGIFMLSPWLFGFATGGAAQWMPVAIGLAVIVTALVTRYELGLIPILGMPTHLVVDGTLGAVLALSPWALGFAGVVALPHVVLGLVPFMGALVSDTRPGPVMATRPRP